MNNNKGYSLTELLLAIFVLSIVMLGIAGIMRSTSQFYRNGVQEVRVQEEAQLAVNLIEELVVDATSAPVWTSSDDDESTDDSDEFVRKISFKDEEESDVEIYFAHGALDPDAPEGTVQYLPGNIIMNVTKKDGTVINDQILAEYVTSFKVAGADAPSTTGDNKISVAVGMDNNGYEYEASKEIYMRNLVENPNISIRTETTSDDDSSTDTWDYEVVLNRFDSYNLTSMCGADPSVEPEKLNGFDDDFEIDSDATSVSVKIKDAVSQAFAVQPNPTHSDSGLRCTRGDSTTFTIKFTFLPVVISANPSSDIFIHYNDDAGVNDDQGYQTYLDVQGIDINKALASGAFTAKANVAIGGSYFMDSGSKYDFVLSSDQKTMANMKTIHVAQMKFGIEPAILDNGIIIACGNGAQLGLYTGNSTTELKVDIILKRTSDNSTYTFPVTYKYRIAGNVL